MDAVLFPPPNTAPAVDAALIAAVSVLNGGGLEVRCRHEVLLSVIPCNVVMGFTDEEGGMFCDDTEGASCEDCEGGDGEGDTEEETGAEVDGDGLFEIEG